MLHWKYSPRLSSQVDLPIDHVTRILVMTIHPIRLGIEGILYGGLNYLCSTDRM